MKTLKTFFVAGVTFLSSFCFQSNAAVVYASASQSQFRLVDNQPYGIGTTNQRMLALSIATTGSGAPALNLSKISLTLTGSSQISRVAIYASPRDPIYPDLTYLYGEVLNPGAKVDITNATKTISGVESIFWVVVDVKPTATVGSVLDVICDSLNAGGTQPKPTVEVSKNAVVSDNLSGVKTIKNDGGDYSSLPAAILDINTKGVGGSGLTVVLNDDETFPQSATDFDNTYKYIRQSGSEASPLIIKRSGTGTAKPIITSPATTGFQDAGNADQILGLLGADYVTIDGLEFRATGIVAPGTYLENGILFRGLFTNGCSNNTVKNCTIDMASANKTRIYCIKFASAATDVTGANNNNMVMNNELKNADAGVNFNQVVDQAPLNVAPVVNDENNEIFGNKITGNFGLEAGGIHIEFCKNTKIYNNILDGVGVETSYSGFMKGITTATSYTMSNCTGFIKCYNNIVRNMVTTDAGTSTKIAGINLLAPEVYIYNNMVSNLKAEKSTGTSATNITSGIQLTTAELFKPNYYVWNNSVYLSQNGSSTITDYKTAPLIILFNQQIGVTMANNIFVNTSTGGLPYAMYSQCYPFSKFGTNDTRVFDENMDHNLYFATPTEGAALIITNNTTATTTVGAGSIPLPAKAQYLTIDDYKTYMATAEQHSMLDFPPFVSPSDLHIQTGIETAIKRAGISLPMVDTDIDGNVRQTTPDLGAHEFSADNAIKNIPAEVFVSISSANGSILIKSTLPQSAQAAIYNIEGKRLSQVTLEAGVNSITVNTKGIFLVRIESNGKTISKKVVL
ncbi:MAG: T9SS type A sorting domain-containing protein [Bacteroidales bacterium]|nr:T9SS type A sorting domain-containing protein [Bacteroidales bacterium]